jgi:hypothetical protein
MSFHSSFRDKDSTTTDKKTTAMTKKTQHTTKTHKKHSNQLVLPVYRSVAYVLLSGSAPSSSSCLYLSSAALSRATCSARSLNFTVSNFQGPALFGGIGREDGRSEVERTTPRKEKEDLKTWRWRCVTYTVIVRGGLRFRELFMGHSTAWLNNLIQHI